MQLAPSNAAVQVQVLEPGLQVPPFWHGLVEQKLGRSQNVPSKFASQLQRPREVAPPTGLVTRFWHVPPFWHGLESHQRAFWHWSPLKKPHEQVAPALTQVPPFWHAGALVEQSKHTHTHTQHAAINTCMHQDTDSDTARSIHFGANADAGAQCTDRHIPNAMEQFWPVPDGLKPLAQAQEKVETVAELILVQVPPFWH